MGLAALAAVSTGFGAEGPPRPGPKPDRPALELEVVVKSATTQSGRLWDRRPWAFDPPGVAGSPPPRFRLPFEFGGPPGPGASTRPDPGDPDDIAPISFDIFFYVIRRASSVRWDGGPGEPIYYVEPAWRNDFNPALSRNPLLVFRSRAFYGQPDRWTAPSLVRFRFEGPLRLMAVNGRPVPPEGRDEESFTAEQLAAVDLRLEFYDPADPARAVEPLSRPGPSGPSNAPGDEKFLLFAFIFGTVAVISLVSLVAMATLFLKAERPTGARQLRDEQPDRAAGQVEEEAQARVKVLFLASDIPGNRNLDITGELAMIQQALDRYGRGDRFQFIPCVAARRSDLRDRLADAPDVVHFSGHGGEDGQLPLRTDDGSGSRSIGAADLVALLQHQKSVRLVFLNACYTEALAEALTSEARIPIAIGMRRTVPDKVAIAFSAGFYQWIGGPNSVQIAFDLGKDAAVEWASGGAGRDVLKVGGGRPGPLAAEIIPQLRWRPDVDPGEFTLFDHRIGEGH